MLAGGPETILLSWLLLSAMWLAQMGQARWGRRAGERRAPALRDSNQRADQDRAELELCAPCAMVWRFPLLVLLVAAISASQLLPFLDLAAHSQREQGYADTRWSMPAWGWANFLVPMVFGQVWSMGVFFQHQQAWTSSYYLGVGALLLALLAIWIVPRRRVWLLAAAATLAVLLALGQQTFVYRWLHRLIPQLSLMTYPVKFVILVAFAVPLLAAFSVLKLQAVDSKETRISQKRLLFLSGILLGLIAIILAWA